MREYRIMKIFSVIIAVIMMLNWFSLTVSADNSNAHVYELYQIFTGTISSDGVLSDVVWGKNGKSPESGVPKGSRVNSSILTELEAVKDGTDTEKLEVIKKYVNLDSAPYRGEENQPVKSEDKREYTYNAIEPGYYLIKDKINSQNRENGVYTLYVAKASGSTLRFEPKESIPTVTKMIDDQGYTGVNSASIGEEIDYIITGTVPSRISDYASYYYKFTDKLSKGAVYKEGSLKVYLKNGSSKEDVTQYFYVGADEYDEVDGTVITVSIRDLKALANAENESSVKYTVNASSEIVVTYKAVLNSNAFIKDPNTNEVKVTYSNDPNNSGTPSEDPPVPPEVTEPDVPVGETVKSRTETYTTALMIKKTNQNSEVLQGAMFSLTGNGVKQVLVTEQVFKESDEGTYYKLKNGTYTQTEPQEDTRNNYENAAIRYVKETVTTLKGDGQREASVQGEVDDNGVITFSGLGAGDYILTEIKAPDGYNKIDPISFTITFDKETKSFSSSYNSFTYSSSDGKLHSTIVDYPGSLLPHTGGIGTTIFYIGGAILVIVAAVILIVKRRMK